MAALLAHTTRLLEVPRLRRQMASTCPWPLRVSVRESFRKSRDDVPTQQCMNAGNSSSALSGCLLHTVQHTYVAVHAARTKLRVHCIFGLSDVTIGGIPRSRYMSSLGCLLASKELILLTALLRLQYVLYVYFELLSVRVF